MKSWFEPTKFEEAPMSNMMAPLPGPSLVTKLPKMMETKFKNTYIYIYIYIYVLMAKAQLREELAGHLLASHSACLTRKCRTGSTRCCNLRHRDRQTMCPKNKITNARTHKNKHKQTQQHTHTTTTTTTQQTKKRVQRCHNVSTFAAASGLAALLGVAVALFGFAA